ncbi:MAG: ribosome hibernation-promoting factor, HPF/YfiA family [Clostridia bacterium]|nr:ribosome-associated translation inhibitor RaiA [Clostridia bacterium]
MNIKITGKDLKATEAIKDYIEKKMERLEKYFETEDLDIQAMIRLERELQIAEISASYKGESYRAVAESKDLYASIDEDIDILERQIRKAKTKKERMNKEESIRAKEIEVAEQHETEGEIIKTTYYGIKPMSAEDAKLILQERKTQSFLAYIDVDTNKVNVIYKLKDGKNFGISEPEV